MRRFLEAARWSVDQHGHIRTGLLLFTAPIRMSLVFLGAGVVWFGHQLEEDYLGALLTGRIFDDED